MEGRWRYILLGVALAAIGVGAYVTHRMTSKHFESQEFRGELESALAGALESFSAGAAVELGSVRSAGFLAFRAAGVRWRGAGGEELVTDLSVNVDVVPHFLRGRARYEVAVLAAAGGKVELGGDFSIAALIRSAKDGSNPRPRRVDGRLEGFSVAQIVGVLFGKPRSSKAELVGGKLSGEIGWPEGRGGELKLQLSVDKPEWRMSLPIGGRGVPLALATVVLDLRVSSRRLSFASPLRLKAPFGEVEYSGQVHLATAEAPARYELEVVSRGGAVVRGLAAMLVRCVSIPAADVFSVRGEPARPRCG